jgi:hypothetical protein
MKYIVPFVFRHQLLSDDDLGPLYDLLIDEPPMIRRAIGELVYDHLIAQNIKTSQPGARGTFLCKHSTFMCQITKDLSNSLVSLVINYMLSRWGK